MRIKVIIFFLILNNTMFAQQVLFNNIYADTLTIRVCRNIIEVDNGYYVLGGGYTPLNIMTGFIDTLGNLNWIKKYGDSNNFWFHGAENSLKELPNKEFILAGGLESLYSDTNSVLLIKFNSLLDIIWTKKYFIDTMQSILYGSGVTKNNEYLFIGVTTLTDYYGNVLFFKTDTSGNLLWYKEYGNNLPNIGYKVTETWDNGYLIGGWTNIGATYTGYSGEWYLIKADSLGNLKWQKNLGNPSYFDGRVCGLIPTKDSCFIATGAYTTGQYDNQDVRRGRIVKIDTYGNIKWSKLYDYTGLFTGILSVIEQPDGNLITLAEVDSVYYTHRHTVLQKLSPNGDLIWRKRIWFMCDSFNCYLGDDAILLSLIQTNDGGFAMAGWVSDGNLNPSQQMWVIKTDSLGNTCYPDSGEIGCMTIVIVEESPTVKGNPNINVFPNPSNGNITVDIQKEVNEETQIDVININGAIIYKTILQPSQTKANINISEFAKGVYFVNVKSSTFTETRKLIIQ